MKKNHLSEKNYCDHCHSDFNGEKTVEDQQDLPNCTDSLNIFDNLVEILQEIAKQEIKLMRDSFLHYQTQAIEAKSCSRKNAMLAFAKLYENRLLEIKQNFFELSHY